MTLKSRTWREEKRESHRVDQARKGGRTKKHKRGSIGFFGLQCTLPVKQKPKRQRKTEKDREDRERQRKTEKDRERQRKTESNTHTHTLKLRHASPKF